MQTIPRAPDLTPPVLFTKAVEELAAQMNLDPYSLLNGLPFQCNGMVFALQHYGSQDETGATAFIDIGAADPGSEAASYKALLERNTIASAFQDGYFGILPQSDRMVYCLRIPLDGGDGDAARIAETLGGLAVGLETIQERLREATATGVPDGMLAASAQRL